MQRIQKLLSATVLLFLAACGEKEKVISVTDFLYAPAQMKAMVASCSVRNDRDTNQTCLNASRAMLMGMTGAFNKCNKSDVADKACVDAVLAKMGKP